MRFMVFTLMVLSSCKRTPAKENSPPLAQREGERPALFAKRVCLSTGEPKACVSYARALGLGEEGLRRDVRAALRRLTSLCHENRGEACLLLGRWYRRGAPLKKDLKMAASWYQRACERGLPAACHEWGETRLLRGASSFALTSLFEEACRRGVGGACHRAGEAHNEKSSSEKWYARGCDLGDHPSCLGLASLIAGEGPRQHQRAAALARAACEAKAPNGCAVLVSLLEGTGAPWEEKIGWLTKGCSQGGAACCERLGIIYYDTPNSPTHLRRAFGYLRSACDRGRSSACAWLGAYWHRHAADGSQTTVAIDYIAKACLSDHTASCATLFQYASGLLTDKLKERWVRGLILMGCERLGRGRVCLEAAQIAKERTPRLAQTFALLACSGGDAKACMTLLPQFRSP